MRGSRVILSFLLVLAAAAAGCSGEDGSFVIRQNQIPGSGCIIGTSSDTYRSIGTLDVSMGYGYFLYPLLENNMLSSESEDGQPERNNLVLHHYEIQLDLGAIPVSTSGDQTDFEALTSGTIAPAGSLASTVKVIKDKLAKQLLQVVPKGNPVGTIGVTLKAVAKLQGNDKSSSTFYYPVDICNGCLVDYRSSCPDTSTDTTVLTNDCGLPQDTPITCCSTKCFTTSSS